jgi:hypothetical protein
MSEPERGRRVWTDKDTGEVKSAERDAAYGNRRRVRGRRGKAARLKETTRSDRTVGASAEQQST